MIASNRSPCSATGAEGKATDKIVAVLEIAADGNLAGAIGLRPPLAPVKGIDGPGRHIVAGAWLGVG